MHWIDKKFTFAISSPDEFLSSVLAIRYAYQSISRIRSL